MALKQKRFQFQLWHLLVAITLVGILVEPARWAYRCICTEEPAQDSLTLTVVPRIIIQSEEESVQEIEIEELDRDPNFEQHRFQRSI